MSSAIVKKSLSGQQLHRIIYARTLDKQMREKYNLNAHKSNTNDINLIKNGKKTYDCRIANSWVDELKNGDRIVLYTRYPDPLEVVVEISNIKKHNNWYDAISELGDKIYPEISNTTDMLRQTYTFNNRNNDKFDIEKNKEEAAKMTAVAINKWAKQPVEVYTFRIKKVTTQASK